MLQGQVAQGQVAQGRSMIPRAINIAASTICAP